MVLSNQLIKISPDLDNLVANGKKKKLGVVHPLKTVLTTKFKSFISDPLEAKRTEDSGGDGLWLQVYFDCEVKNLSQTFRREICVLEANGAPEICPITQSS